MTLRRTLAALGAAALLLGGCGGDPEPKVDPTTPTPTLSPDESETAKPMSAEDVIRKWVQVQLDAQNTGDTSKLREQFSHCVACRSFANKIDAAYAHGGYVKAGAWRIRSIELAGHVDSRYEYNLTITAQPTKLLLKGDGKVKTFNGGPESFRMIFRKRAGSVVLTDYQAMP